MLPHRVLVYYLDLRSVHIHIHIHIHIHGEGGY